MDSTIKVAKWEIKRNLKNKSFIIGLFITPILFALFAIIPSLFSSDEDPIDVFIKDELNVYSSIDTLVDQTDFLQWELHETDLNEAAIFDQLDSRKRMAYIPLTADVLEEGTITVHTSDDVDDYFLNQVNIIEEPVKQLQFAELDLTNEQLEAVTKGITFNIVSRGKEGTVENENNTQATQTDPLKRIIPGIFAGIILFSIVISGMMIFQSASQEKKDKIAEIILSSLTPNELMQGKIIGYFILGIIQVLVWLGFIIPIVLWKVDLPVFEYLFVPELAILLLIAVLGYLLYAAIFVGIGATIEDVSTSGNFQGLVFMLPFLPFVLFAPIGSDPSGVIAKIATFIPFTTPGVLLLRLSILEEWPWIEVTIAIVTLIFSVWLFMKLAGKIFKTGILLYGKNATPKEIWKWLWIKAD